MKELENRAAGDVPDNAVESKSCVVHEQNEFGHPMDRKVEEVKTALAPWFALRVRPNFEKPVAAALRGKGFQEFLPLVRSRRQWSDRVKEMDLPLFPGYLFCRLNLEERMPLVTTPGFLYLVGVGKNPEPVEEDEIAAIQSVLRSGLPVTPWPSLMVGQKVRLRHGPLRGLEGVLTKIANQHRMYVAVTLLKRSISVEVAPEWIHPMDEPSKSASHLEISPGSISPAMDVRTASENGNS